MQLATQAGRYITEKRAPVDKPNDRAWQQNRLQALGELRLDVVSLSA